MKKFGYTINKPAKVENQKSGYVSTQETTPNRPITITYDGKKVLDVYGTVDSPRAFAMAVVRTLNSAIVDEPKVTKTING
jgi:hypothetical protein